MWYLKDLKDNSWDFVKKRSLTKSLQHYLWWGCVGGWPIGSNCCKWKGIIAMARTRMVIHQSWLQHLGDMLLACNWLLCQSFGFLWPKGRVLSEILLSSCILGIPCMSLSMLAIDVQFCIYFHHPFLGVNGQLNFELQLVNLKKKQSFWSLFGLSEAACQNSHKKKTIGALTLATYNLGAKVDLLSLLLKRQPESVSLGDADGDTALHHVAQATELEVWRKNMFALTSWRVNWWFWRDVFFGGQVNAKIRRDFAY